MTSALNFDTADCHVVGGCDLYITKAVGADRKLYRAIDHALESQYASLRSLQDSLPQTQAAAVAGSLNLSRASPFGSLSRTSSRRTFAHLIATLNASHQDYDFSHLLRPSDFRRERSLKRVMNNLDTMLYSLRPKPAVAFSDPHLYQASPASATNVPPLSPGKESWNPRMWRLVDKEMDLKTCDVYCYAPEEDPYDGDEGAIWSYNYFFFNKVRKRVCYIYLRGLSIISHSPLERTSIKVLRHAPVRPKDRCSSHTSGKKRAQYWLGDRAEDLSSDEENGRLEQGDDDHDNDDDDGEDLDLHVGDTLNDPISVSDDDEVGTVRHTLSPDEQRLFRGVGRSYNLRSRSKSATPAGVSEHAAATMDL